MARDHRKLRVFHEAHRLTLLIYKETKNFPRDEWFGIRLQMRRAAVSVASNLVEGNARRASASEVEYLIQLASELDYFTAAVYKSLLDRWTQLVPLVQSMEARLEQERRAKKARAKRLPERLPNPPETRA